MAGCAISSSSISGWCARRWPSARCCGNRAAHRAADALRAALPAGACGRPGCCASACSCTTTWAAGKRLPGTRVLDLGAGCGRRAAQARRVHHRASSTPTAGSTMRAWSFSTRVDAARRGADIRVRTRALEAVARGGCVAPDGGRTSHTGARETIAARMLVNAAGPWVSDVAAVSLRAKMRGQRAPGAGLAHRRPQAVRARSRLPVPEPGRPRRVRHPLRGRLHADRHHRSRLCRRPCGGDCNQRGDRLSVRDGQRLASRSRCARADVVWSYCGRAAALRRRRRARRRPPRATTCWRWTRRRARRLCWRSSAARSPPTAASPRPCCERLLPYLPERPRRGRRLDRRHAAAGRRLRPRRAWRAGDPSGRRLPLPERSHAPASRTPTAARHGALLGKRPAAADLGRDVRRHAHRGRGALPHRRRNGPAPPRTWSGAAPSSGCACPRPRSPPSMTGCANSAPPPAAARSRDRGGRQPCSLLHSIPRNLVHRRGHPRNECISRALVAESRQSSGARHGGEKLFEGGTDARSPLAATVSWHHVRRQCRGT